MPKFKRLIRSKKSKVKRKWNEEKSFFLDFGLILFWNARLKTTWILNHSLDVDRYSVSNIWHNPNTWISHLVYAKAKIEGESLKGQDTKIKFHTHSSSNLPVYGSLKDLIRDVWSSMLKFGEVFELFESFLGTFCFFGANKIFWKF